MSQQLVLPKIFAHRGGRKSTPENTAAAFKNSMHLGVAGIELDIQRCATGEIVVIHDEDINRTTNGAGLVKDISLAELKRISAGSWFDQKFASENVPTLQEVLEIIDGNLILNIEVKNAPVSYDGIDDDLLELLSHYQHPDTIIVSSFDHKLLLKISQKTDIAIALLAECVFFDLQAYATTLGASFWHPPYDVVRPELVEEAHANGLLVNVWTVNDERKWRKLIDMGVDGIITDDPEGLSVFLDEVSLAT
jgi:glycerophosphoryl diester phosphodiesterase